MKKLLIILLFIPLISFGQEYTSSDSNLLTEINSKYITVSKAKVYNKKTYVSLDYGQELKTGLSAQAIRVNGKKVKFSSILNVINILDNYDVIQMIPDDSSTVILLSYNKKN
jgi:hypothetical protein